MTIHKVNIARCLQACEGHWAPNTPTQFDDYDVTILKTLGEMIWTLDNHHDRLFLLLEGQMDIQLNDGWMTLSTGELCIISKGTNHRPVAKKEAHVLLINSRGPSARPAMIQTPNRLHS